MKFLRIGKTPHNSVFQAMFIVATDGTRALMMDFGFGGFLDKFENRFGRWPTTLLLVLIALSITSFCIHLIGQYAVSPFLTLIRDLFIDGPPSRFEAFRTVGVILNILLFVFVFLQVRHAIEARQEYKNAQKAADDYAVFREFAVDFWNATSGFYGELQTALVYLESAKNKKERDKAMERIHQVIERNRQEYLERVTNFNKTNDVSANSARSNSREADPGSDVTLD